MDTMDKQVIMKVLSKYRIIEEQKNEYMDGGWWAELKPDYVSDEILAEQLGEYCCFMARGKADISRAMSILNAIPEVGSDYFDEGITNAFNELDDVLNNWQCECDRLDKDGS